MKLSSTIIAATLSLFGNVQGKAAVQMLAAGLQEVKLQWGSDSAVGPYLNFYANKTMLNTSTLYDKNNTNGKENVSKIEMPANSSIKFGNLWEPEARGGGHEQYTFRLRSYEGCDETGENCNAHMDHANTVEWSYDTYLGDVGINLSNVDGYNMPVALEFGQNSTCKPRYCQVYPEDLEKLCPAENLWKINGTIGWVSDCRRTGSSEHCCPLPIGPNECAPSNQYLKALCEWAYAYAYDDMVYQSCNPDGEMRVYMG